MPFLSADADSAWPVPDGGVHFSDGCLRGIAARASSAGGIAALAHHGRRWRRGEGGRGRADGCHDGEKSGANGRNQSTATAGVCVCVRVVRLLPPFVLAHELTKTLNVGVDWTAVMSRNVEKF